MGVYEMKKRRVEDPVTGGVVVDAVEDATPINRRTFLVRGSVALAAAAVLAGAPRVLRTGSTRESSSTTPLSRRQRETLAAVQEHLFPRGEDSPGADDVNALSYLTAALAVPGFNPDTRNSIVNGIQRLHDASHEQFGIHFVGLTEPRKETLLRYLADRTRWGERWLSLILYYIFEALLSDPVYGGNPNGIGWKWLDHRPGFPRPPADKIFGKL